MKEDEKESKESEGDYTCPWGCGCTRPFRVDKMAWGDDWPRCPECGGN